MWKNRRNAIITQTVKTPKTVRNVDDIMFIFVQILNKYIVISKDSMKIQALYKTMQRIILSPAIISSNEKCTSVQ